MPSSPSSDMATEYLALGGSSPNVVSNKPGLLALAVDIGAGGEDDVMWLFWGTLGDMTRGDVGVRTRGGDFSGTYIY